MTQKQFQKCLHRFFFKPEGRASVLHIIIVLCLLNLHSVQCFTCSRPQCDNQVCPELATAVANCHDGNTTLDFCGCCKVCLRAENETCGGQDGHLGICQEGFQCILLNNENQTLDFNVLGTCQDPSSFCFNRTASQQTGCLYKEGGVGCVCMHVNSCDKVQFQYGDLKECRKVWKEKEEVLKVKKTKCLNVTCNTKEDPCPIDSYRLSNSSDDICCPEYHKCECLPTACKDIKCPKDLHPKVVRPKTGMPGTCCSTFECVNETETSCQFENKIYQNGAKWKSEKCTACSCKSGMAFCQAITCDQSMICGYMFYPEGECCPVCNGCVSPSGKFYNNSVIWKEDDCTTCQCIEGKMHCQVEMCQVSCAHPRTVAGHCCAVCDDPNPLDKLTKEPSHPSQTALSPFPAHDVCRVERNREYGPEEMWYDGCRQCYCHNGREMCAVLTCPLVHCDHPRTLPNHCCPVCSGDHHAIQPYSSTICHAVDGRYHVEGESWSLDPCTWCICVKGQVLCEATQCPPTPCAHPVRHLGSCCTTCPEKHAISQPSNYCFSEDGMTVYAEGQQWRASDCKSCICLHNKVQCFQETCPVVDCSHPLMVKHRCCPVCLGQKNSRTLVCLQNGRTYRDGEHWSVNACTTCACVKGMQMCTEKVCPPWCARPVHVPGQCCPLCEGEGSDYGSSPSQLSLAIVVICATIMVLLVLVIVFLVMAILRQGKNSNRSSPCQGAIGQSLCRGQRPKSTNLELQGCSKPLLDSNNELKKLQDQGSAVMKNL